MDDGQNEPPRTPKQQARDARRAAIRAAIDAGEPAADVAQRFGVSVRHVYACSHDGVRKLKQRKSIDMLVVIAELCTTDASIAAIALRHSCTQQNISLLYRRCVQAGVPVRPRKQNGAR